jgi:L-asparaginase
LPIGDLRTDAKENLITAIQIVSLRENNLPVISEVCLILNCIEAIELLKLMRNTLKLTSPNYPHLVESGVHLKKVARAILAQKKAQATGTKSLIAMW